MASVDQPVSFEAHVKPMFRDRDRRSMEFAFDLWSYDDVSQHADAILGRLKAGTMPCDGAWPPEQVDLFRRWVESRKPRRPAGVGRGYLLASSTAGVRFTRSPDVADLSMAAMSSWRRTASAKSGTVCDPSSMSVAKAA